MPSLNTTSLGRHLIAAVAAALALALLAVGGSAAAQPGATSGNFLLRKGVYAPLEDFSGGAATAYTSTNNRGEFAGTYTDAGGDTARLPP